MQTNHLVQPVVFQNTYHQYLAGIWHQPGNDYVDTGRSDCAIVMLHGWSGYRTGPHQMLTRAARIFAARGHAVLRFDFAGRGDSEGDAEVTTLATMADDTRAALGWCRSQGVQKFILLGLCSGCEVAFATAADEGVRALALWSAPVFAAGQDGETASVSQLRKRAANLRKYARKLVKPATWRKILTRSVDTASVKKAVGKGGGEAHRNVETDAAGHLPPGWRRAALERFEQANVPRLMIYGTADPTTEEALAWHRAHGKMPPAVHMVAGANHSFYGLAWEQEVIEVTAQWLEKVAVAR
jgi:pimeloyl-ACP methyl ester carboxylesterase